MDRMDERTDEPIDDAEKRPVERRDSTVPVDPDAGSPPSGQLLGEGAAGIAGVAAGAAIGSLAGPIGSIVGGLAGAASGWWAGHAILEAAGTFKDDDAYYRAHYQSQPNRLADLTYDECRPAYQLGHLAASNPDYSGKRFEEIEDDLRKQWDEKVSGPPGPWEQIRPYVNDAYARRSERRASATSTAGAHEPLDRASSDNAP